jgi:cytoskeletal protein RodZ
VAEVAERLMLTSRQVEALEDGDTSAFDSSSYYLNALRRYAVFAEIDPGFVTRVRTAMTPTSAERGVGAGRALAASAVALLVVASLGGGAWWLSRSRGTAVTHDSPTPIPTIVFSQDPSTPAPVAASPHEDAATRADGPSGRAAAAVASRTEALAQTAPMAEASSAGAAAVDTRRAASTIERTGEPKGSSGQRSRKAEDTSTMAHADAGQPAQPKGEQPRSKPQPPVVSGAFGALRVRDATWVLVRDANDSVVGRTLPADAALLLDSPPTYLAAGTPNVDLFVGTRRIDVADFVVNGQLEMRTSDFALLAERDNTARGAQRR